MRENKNGHLAYRFSCLSGIDYDKLINENGNDLQQGSVNYD